MVLLVMLALGVVALGLASASAQSQSRRAAVVLRMAEGQNLVKCVQFAEDSLTGAELLARTGWNVVIDVSSGLGGAVCSINGKGCPVTDCFCQCPGGSQCEYWSYWHWDGDKWDYSDFGAGGYTVTDGALEGWSWGPGNFETGTEPPEFTFDQVCNPALVGITPSPVGNPPATVSKPPDGTFEVANPTVSAGACTLLTWVVFDATRVTLNGAQVMAQDRQEFCPTITTRYTLLATNATGSFTREVTVQVADAQPPVQPTSVLPGPVAPASQAPTLPTQPVPAEPPAQPLPAAPSPTPFAVAQPLATPGMALPIATLALAPILPVATGTPAALSLALTALPTQVPTRAAQGGGLGGPTPTPILLARVAVGELGAPAAAGSTPATGFDMGLLSGYGAFLLIAALLASAAAWVWQRVR
jgi:hypothetical protein